jgi:hypothetical protein
MSSAPAGFQRRRNKGTVTALLRNYYEKRITMFL